VRAVPCLCGFYPDICLTTEEKAQKTLSPGSRRLPADTLKISNFMNISALGAEFLPCGRADMKKLIVPFRSFANAPKNYLKRCPKTEAVKIEGRICYACSRKEGLEALLVTGAGQDLSSACTIDFPNVGSCTFMSSSDDECVTTGY